MSARSQRSPSGPWWTRARVFLPALIALTSVLGAVGAWRAAEARGAAGGAEQKALADSVAVEQERAGIETVLGSIEFLYARKAAAMATADALRAEAEHASPDDADRLLAEADAHQAVAAAFVIDPDALRPDGSLDLQAKRDLEWVLAADRHDLDPGPELARADALRTRSEQLVGLTALLIAAALFLTLAEVSRSPRSQRLLFEGGMVVLLTSAVLLVVVEAT